MTGEEMADVTDELGRAERALIVGLGAPILALLLWFGGVPLLGWMIEDWGTFLIAVTVGVAAYAVLLGAGVAWILRGPSRR